MLGSSDDEDTDTGFDATRLDRLVQQADGDSVAAERLRGAETYYPDAIEFLTEEERPQHLVLLTTSVPTVRQLSNYADGMGESARMITGNGVLVVNEQSVRIVVDDRTWLFPYETLDRVEYRDDEIRLLVGSIDHLCNVAASADEDETRAGFRALESRFLDAHR